MSQSTPRQIAFAVLTLIVVFPLCVAFYIAPISLFQHIEVSLKTGAITDALAADVGLLVWGILAGAFLFMPKR